MTLVLLGTLCSLAVACGWLVDGRLRGARWTDASPANGLFVWHCMALTVVMSTVAFAVLATHDALEHALLMATDLAKPEIHAAYAGEAQMGGAWNLSFLLVGGGLMALSISAWRTVRSRDAVTTPRETRQLDSPHGRVSIVSGDRLFAYCTPRRFDRKGGIFLSEGAVLGLEPEELGAVVGHERAHLNRRHHAMVLCAEIFVSAIRPLGVLPSYADEVRRLVELDADDIACARVSQHTLARALLKMATLSSPSQHGLAVAGTPTAARIQRLIGGRPPGRNVARVMTILAAAATVAPLVGMGGPALWALTT